MILFILKNITFIKRMSSEMCLIFLHGVGDRGDQWTDFFRRVGIPGAQLGGGGGL